MVQLRFLEAVFAIILVETSLMVAAETSNVKHGFVPLPSTFDNNTLSDLTAIQSLNQLTKSVIGEEKLPVNSCMDILDIIPTGVVAINCILFCATCGRGSVCADTHTNLVATMCTCNCNPRIPQFLKCQNYMANQFCTVPSGLPENASDLANCNSACQAQKFRTGVLCGLNWPKKITCTCLC